MTEENLRQQILLLVEQYSQIKIAQVIIDYLGRGYIKVIDSQTDMHEARILQLNCDKAHQLLGWYPRWDAQKTLSETALWYKNFISGCNVQEIT